MIDLDTVINSYSEIIFYTGDGEVVKGFSNSEFSISGTAQYGSEFEMAQQDTLSKALQGVASVSNLLLGTKFSQVQMKSLMQTVATWTGSQKPSFNLSLVFVAYRSGIDVTLEVKKLLKGVYPVGTHILKAPYEYGVDGLKGINTCALKISQWFFAQDLILRDVKATFSKEVTNEGRPLYANVSVTIEPFRMINAEEILGYFINSGSPMSKTVSEYEKEKGIRRRIIRIPE